MAPSLMQKTGTQWHFLHSRFLDGMRNFSPHPTKLSEYFWGWNKSINFSYDTNFLLSNCFALTGLGNESKFQSNWPEYFNQLMKSTENCILPFFNDFCFVTAPDKLNTSTSVSPNLKITWNRLGYVFSVAGISVWFSNIYLI